MFYGNGVNVGFFDSLQEEGFHCLAHVSSSPFHRLDHRYWDLPYFISFSGRASNFGSAQPRKPKLGTPGDSRVPNSL